MKLNYDGEVIDFLELESLTQIKESFHIIDSKNLYRVNEVGELVLLEDDSWRKKLREGDKIEAISEFTLG